MALDIRTLVVIALLTSVVSFFSMIFLYLGHRRETALRYGVIGLGLQCVGLLLIGLRFLIPDTLSIVAANTLLIASYSCMVAVARIFYGRPPAWTLLAIAPLLTLALFGYFTWVRDDATTRTFLYSATTAILMPLIAREFARPIEDETWSGPRLLLQTTLYAYTLAMLLRILLVMVGGEIGIMNPSAGNALAFIVGTMLIGFWPFGLALLVGQRLQGQQRHLATTDPLTGILNRRGFEECVELELARSRRTGETVSLLLLDIDHFKRINDLYGHLAGDSALARFADRIGSTLREIDSFGRLGGEEFATLLPATSHAQALEAAERLHNSIVGLELKAGDRPYSLTVSIGVASNDGDGEDYASLYREVDRRLYVAKEAGRNRVVGREAETHQAEVSPGS